MGASLHVLGDTHLIEHSVVFVRDKQRDRDEEFNTKNISKTVFSYLNNKLELLLCILSILKTQVGFGIFITANCITCTPCMSMLIRRVLPV